MTIKQLKEAIENYKDDANVQVVLKNGFSHIDEDMDIIYDNALYDMWVEGEDEEKDILGRIRNSNSKTVSICFYR